MVEEKNRILTVPPCIIVSDTDMLIKKEICLKDLKTNEEVINFVNIASKLGMVSQPGLIA